MKDAKGHGSNPRGGKLTPVQQENAPFKSRLGKAAGHSYLDPNDPRASGGQPMRSNETAASNLASGPKSAPAPAHDAMKESHDRDAQWVRQRGGKAIPTNSGTPRNNLPHWPQPGEPGGRPAGYKSPGDFRTRDPSGRLTRQRRK